MLALLTGAAWTCVVILASLIAYSIREDIRTRPPKAKPSADPGVGMTKEEKIKTVQERIQ
jgi:hypothetical protein